MGQQLHQLDRLGFYFLDLNNTTTRRILHLFGLRIYSQLLPENTNLGTNVILKNAKNANFISAQL